MLFHTRNCFTSHSPVVVDEQYILPNLIYYVSKARKILWSIQYLDYAIYQGKGKYLCFFLVIQGTCLTSQRCTNWSRRNQLQLWGARLLSSQSTFIQQSIYRAAKKQGTFKHQGVWLCFLTGQLSQGKHMLEQVWLIHQVSWFHGPS